MILFVRLTHLIFDPRCLQPILTNNCHSKQPLNERRSSLLYSTNVDKETFRRLFLLKEQNQHTWWQRRLAFETCCCAWSQRRRRWRRWCCISLNTRWALYDRTKRGLQPLIVCKSFFRLLLLMLLLQLNDWLFQLAMGGWQRSRLITFSIGQRWWRG